MDISDMNSHTLQRSEANEVNIYRLGKYKLYVNATRKGNKKNANIYIYKNKNNKKYDTFDAIWDNNILENVESIVFCTDIEPNDHLQFAIIYEKCQKLNTIIYMTNNSVSWKFYVCMQNMTADNMYDKIEYFDIGMRSVNVYKNILEPLYASYNKNSLNEMKEQAQKKNNSIQSKIKRFIMPGKKKMIYV